MLKVTANLKNTFYEDKEMSDIMMEYYLIKRNPPFINSHNFMFSICLKYVEVFDFVNFLEIGKINKVEIFRVS